MSSLDQAPKMSIAQCLSPLPSSTGCICSSANCSFLCHLLPPFVVITLEHLSWHPIPCLMHEPNTSKLTSTSFGKKSLIVTSNFAISQLLAKLLISSPKASPSIAFSFCVTNYRLFLPSGPGGVLRVL
jgi:hypothetical protein